MSERAEGQRRLETFEHPSEGLRVTFPIGSKSKLKKLRQNIRSVRGKQTPTETPEQHRQSISKQTQDMKSIRTESREGVGLSKSSTPIGKEDDSDSNDDNIEGSQSQSNSGIVHIHKPQFAENDTGVNPTIQSYQLGTGGLENTPGNAQIRAVVAPDINLGSSSNSASMADQSGINSLNKENGDIISRGISDASMNSTDSPHEEVDLYFPVLRKKTTTSLGLFGQTSANITLAELPKLKSIATCDFQPWKDMTIQVLSSNRLLSLIDKSPQESFQEALIMDSGQTDPITIRNYFVTLCVRVWTMIYTATVKVLHLSFFHAIGKVGPIEYINCPIESTAWMDTFKYGNPFLLWQAILNKLDDGEACDAHQSLLQAQNFRYKYGSDHGMLGDYHEKP